MSENRSFFRLNPGSRLGPYTILSMIGQGRRTEVYRASSPAYRQELAVKVIHAPVGIDDTTTACLKSRTETIAAIRHPNLVKIHESGVARQAFYVTTELVQGSTLRDLISAHPTGLDRDTTQRIFSQLASALAAAHDSDVVHGNIKPDNVLIDGSNRPVLTDFAIPCLFGSHGLPDDFNTLPYLSPEQLTGAAATIQSDIYMLGVLLYEMVTGDVPFKSTSVTEFADLHQHRPPTPPSQVRVDLTPQVERVILKALNKQPPERFHSTREMVADLERHEATSQYETLAFDRDVAEQIRKRRSEIRQFERTRIDHPAPPHAPQSQPLTSGPNWWIVTAIVAVVIVVILALLIG